MTIIPGGVPRPVGFILAGYHADYRPSGVAGQFQLLRLEEPRQS